LKKQAHIPAPHPSNTPPASQRPVSLHALTRSLAERGSQVHC
jgi:hypothetical protein